jgi:hypothetical protein
MIPRTPSPEMTTGASDMAKTKKAGRPPLPAKDAARETIINMKGSPEYAEWLDSLHKRTYISKVQIVRLALKEWAAKNGHPAPPDL